MLARITGTNIIMLMMKERKKVILFFPYSVYVLLIFVPSVFVSVLRKIRADRAVLVRAQRVKCGFLASIPLGVCLDGFRYTCL